MQLSDVGVIEAGQHADLADKPRRQVWFGDQVREKHLHRLNAVRNYVTNLVDVSHAACPKHADHFVVANSLAYRESHQVTSDRSAQNNGAGGRSFVSSGSAQPNMQDQQRHHTISSAAYDKQD